LPIERVFSILPATVMASAAVLPVVASQIERSARRDWAVSTVIIAYDVRVRVRADDAALLEKLEVRLPPGSVAAHAETFHLDYSIVTDPVGADSDNERRAYSGFAGTAAFALSVDEPTLLDAFESIVRFDIAVATDWVFVHSGVVVWNGAAIAVPAPSMHGKSRLVDALVRAGAIYYSDEYAVIDSQGFVHPFQSPISLRTASGTVRRTMLRNPNFAGAVPLRLVVSTRYEPGAEWRPRRGTAAEALLVLLSNTVRARLAPRETLRVLARAVARAELLEGCRGEAESVALLLLEDQHEA